MRYFLFILLIITTHHANSSPIPAFPFVTVTGHSEREVKPDHATLDFTLTISNKSAESGVKELQLLTLSVLDILRTNNIKELDIVAYDVNKREKRNRQINQADDVITGYVFTRSIKVQLSTLEYYGKILASLYKLDNLTNIKTRFDYSNRQQVETELLAIAAQKAREKAHVMAKGLNVELGRVHAFNETGSFTSFFATFGLSNSGYGGVERMRTDMVSNDFQDTIFIPESINISKMVNVIYQLK